MKELPNNSRLFITEDIWHDNVWFIRTEAELIARLKFIEYKGRRWEFYFYPLKINIRQKTLKTSLETIERLFKKYWRKVYEIHN